MEKRIHFVVILFIVTLFISCSACFPQHCISTTNVDTYSFDSGDWLVWTIAKLSISGENFDNDDFLFSKRSLEYYNLTGPYVQQGDLLRYHILNVTHLYYDLYIKDIKIDWFKGPVYPTTFKIMYSLNHDWETWIIGTENESAFDVILNSSSVSIAIDWVDFLDYNGSSQSNETHYYVTQTFINRTSGLLVFFNQKVINTDIQIDYRLEYLGKFQYDPYKRSKLFSYSGYLGIILTLIILVKQNRKKPIVRF